MAKRFTDTAKWDDPWFAELPVSHKLLWVYILDRCDMSGAWKVNKKMAEFCLSTPLDFDAFLASAGPRVRVLKNGDVWFINKFINFQYGVLTEANKIHKRVCSSLQSIGLNKGDISPINGVKEKDMVKEQDIKGVLGEKKGDQPHEWSVPPADFKALIKKLK